jgi:hypothetical protein
MLRSRAVPVAATLALGAAIYWQTRSGRNQPTGRAEGKQYPISETLPDVGGSGGKHARKEDPEYDAGKDTRIMSHSPTSVKKSDIKVEDRSEGRP